MVDFNAIRARNAEILKAKTALAVEADLKEVFDGPVKREKTYVEFVTELLDGHPITEWEQGFCKSLKTWLRKDGVLSQKQKTTLDKLIIQYGLSLEAND